MTDGLPFPVPLHHHAVGDHEPTHHQSRAHSVYELTHHVALAIVPGAAPDDVLRVRARPECEAIVVASWFDIYITLYTTFSSNHSTLQLSFCLNAPSSSNVLLRHMRHRA